LDLLANFGGKPVVVSIQPKYEIDDLFADLQTGQYLRITAIDKDCDPPQYTLEADDGSGVPFPVRCPEPALLDFYRFVGKQGSLALDASDPAPLAFLTEGERLAQLEEIVREGLPAFLRTGEALSEIKRDNLYLQTHRTFEDYCKNKWGISVSQGDRLIQYAAVAAALPPTGETPKTQNQYRALAALPEQVREQAWAEANKDGTATGAKIREAGLRLAAELELEGEHAGDLTEEEKHPSELPLTESEQALMHQFVEGSVSPVGGVPGEIQETASEMGLQVFEVHEARAIECVEEEDLLLFSPRFDPALIRGNCAYCFAAEGLIIYPGLRRHDFWDWFQGHGEILCGGEPNDP
jgi:hypothetical protein